MIIFYIVLKKGAIFFITVLLSLSSAFATDRGGYFDIQNGSEYLGFSTMSKEFKISSLMNSAITNDAKATKIFIASGADVNQKNLAGATALHLAARNNSFESAQILIENGAEVSEKDNEGWTPLMRASLAGNSKMMQLLIENGAQIWIQNSFGETALIHTAMADCYECGKLIVNDNITNNYLVKNQLKQALEIVNKRYNEPFINLLSQYINTETILILDSDKQQDSEKALKTEVAKDTAEGGNIIQLIYSFTGKTLTTDKRKEMAKNTYDDLVKEQKTKDTKPIVVNINENIPAETTKYKLTPINGSKLTTEKPVNIIKEENTKTILKIIKEQDTNTVLKNINDNTPEETTKYKLTPINGSKLTMEKPVNIIKEQDTNTVLKNINENTPAETTKYKLTPINGSKFTIEKEKNEPIKTKKTKVESKKSVNHKFTGTKQEPNAAIEEDKSTRDPNKYKLNPVLLKSAIEKEKQSSIKTENNANKNYSFNSGIEEKKKNMKIINSNDKLNPDN